MPDISVGAQIFDIAFHPTASVVYTGLLTGEVKAYGYDDDGQDDPVCKFRVRPSKRSCRGITLSEDGSRLWATGKSKGIYTIDTTLGEVIETRKAAHDVAINRIKRIMPNMFATGDDDGVVKLWDPRQPEAIRAYTHHFDFISDFLWLEDKKHLVCTSGDGTLSVLDVRSKKTEPFAQSEDQEDELLSVVAIKGGQKLVVGTQLGILSVFNRRSGYGDCVDRIPGHPHSIDALCTIPSHYPNAQSTILTGSSDGFLRAVQILPTKLIGVVADHGDFPVERIAIDRGGEGRWVASSGHDETLKLTDLKEIFEDDGDEEEVEDEEEDEDDDEEGGKAEVQGSGGEEEGKEKEAAEDEDEEEEKEKGSDSDAEPEANVRVADDSSDDEGFKEKKRKRKKETDPFKAVKKSKGKNEIEGDASFFDDL
ncbi:WD40 repeat-like protein [Phanerochaete sordida]|uniref:WD repeat-containing protein JIP5 n=1 Tax=Phanerochaete sordida TaxID=48140 RepID=A0A9P3LG56_9APHY|nr:WD40 repeat-like protein [Phanerochaete sordida]